MPWLIRLPWEQRDEPPPSCDVGRDAIGVVDLELPAFPAGGEEQAPDEPLEDFAERLLLRFLRLCENPRTRHRTLALVKGSVSGGRRGRRFYALLNRVVVHPFARAAGVRTSALRVELVASQLTGVAMMRYVLEVEPIASAPVEDLAHEMAPSLRAALQC